MEPLSAAGTKRHRRLALLLVFLGVAVLLLGTAITSQAYVTKTGHDTLEDFTDGHFSSTGLLKLGEEESVHLLPIGLFAEWKFDSNDALPRPLTQLMAVAAGGHVVMMGGIDDNLDYRSEVYFSTINEEDGSLNGWTATSSLPQNLASAAAVAYPKDGNSSWIYVLGGTAGAGASNKVFYALLNHNTGQVGTWSETTAMSESVKYLQATVLNDFIYAIGGNRPTGIERGPIDKAFYAPINQANGTLGGWTEAMSMPNGIEQHLATAFSSEGNAGNEVNTIYVIGGRKPTGAHTTAPSGKVMLTDIASDGSLSSWTETGADLPWPLYAHSGVAFRGQILATGGVELQTSEETTPSVKAALIEPDDPDRLHDWGGDIGFWETGPLLKVPGTEESTPRAYHTTVAHQHFVYTLGGVDAAGDATDWVYWGTVDEPGAHYVPNGYYVSPPFKFQEARDIHRLAWGTVMSFTEDMTVTMNYRFKRQGETEWPAWESTRARESQNLTNTWTFGEPITDVREFQYRAYFETKLDTWSPRLTWVDVYYDVTDPDLAVTKNTGTVISAELGSILDYTLLFTNSGEWQADRVVLTETMPANTTYAGDSSWSRVGASDLYTHLLGTLAGEAHGSALFRVKINDAVPAGVAMITNQVEIGYPPFPDEIGNQIQDPTPGDNRFELGTILSKYAMSIAKTADPAPGTQVSPGDRIKYTISYSNIGEKTIRDIDLEDIVPGWVSYVSGSIWPQAAGNDSNSKRLRWSVESLAPGATGTVGFDVKVKGDAEDGTIIENSATAGSVNTNSKTSNKVTHSVYVYEPHFSLSLSKSATPASYSEVKPGDQIDYEVSYENDGDDPITDLILSDTLHQDVIYVPGSIWPAAKGDDSDPTNLKWTIGNLAPGASGTVRFSAKVGANLPGGVSIFNQCSGHTPETGSVASNKVWHDTYIEGPDLTITRIVAVPPDPEVGDPFDLIVTVKNQGSMDASGGQLWVGVYVKPHPSSEPTGPADHHLGYCEDESCAQTRDNYVEYKDGLEAGQSFPFRFTGLRLPGSDSGLHEIYAQADVCFEGYTCTDPRWGFFLEQNENNNITRMIMSGSVVYLPIINRNH